MKPGGGRAKGRAFEQAVARQLREKFPHLTGIRRGLQFRDGADAPDVVFPGYRIECKRCRRANIQRAMLQVIQDAKDAKDPGIPCVVSQDDRSEALITFRFADWLKDQTTIHVDPECADGLTSN